MSHEELESIEVLLEKLKKKDYKQVWRVLYGDGLGKLELSEKCVKLAHRYKLELIACQFNMCKDEQLRPQRMVRVGLFQQKLPVPLSFPIRKVKTEMYTLAMDAVKVAAKGGVKIFCLQQAWNMPYAFCQGERAPWNEYAERAEDGPTTRILQALAAENNMVIISTIIERDDIFDDRIWNTAIVIDNYGRVLGKHRRNHIPKVENPNEPTYYCEGNTGHPVFQTEFGRIAVNICYDRHHPLSWLGFAVNRAEIVFNPSAAIGEEFEPLWAIEARHAAMANSYYVCAVNRVGTEIYEHEYETEDGQIVKHRNSGNFFGSSYVAAPDGTRSPGLNCLPTGQYMCLSLPLEEMSGHEVPRFLHMLCFYVLRPLENHGLSRTSNGLLIAEFDLNMCRQVRDERGFDITQRLELYRKSISEAAGRGEA